MAKYDIAVMHGQLFKGPNMTAVAKDTLEVAQIIEDQGLVQEGLTSAILIYSSETLTDVTLRFHEGKAAEHSIKLALNSDRSVSWYMVTSIQGITDLDILGVGLDRGYCESVAAARKEAAEWLNNVASQVSVMAKFYEGKVDARDLI